MKQHAISIIMLAIGFGTWAICERSPKPLLTLLAVLLHEIGHWGAIKLFHCALKDFCWNACEARLVLNGTLSYGKEIFVCLAGPAINLVSVLLSISVGGSLFGEDTPSFFATVSAALALLNLLPAGDLDGGRILYCILARLAGPRAALYICGFFSFVTLFCLWSVSVYALLRTGGTLSLFLFSASLFLHIFVDDASWKIKRIKKDTRE